jgi:hypothetical protein
MHAKSHDGSFSKGRFLLSSSGSELSSVECSHKGRNGFCVVGIPCRTKRVVARVARWYIFKPKLQIWLVLEEGLVMEDVGLFYGHLVYFTAIWYILLTFGLFSAIWYILLTSGIYYGHLVYFSRFGML